MDAKDHPASNNALRRVCGLEWLWRYWTSSSGSMVLLYRLFAYAVPPAVYSFTMTSGGSCSCSKAPQVHGGAGVQKQSSAWRMFSLSLGACQGEVISILRRRIGTKRRKE